MSDKTKVAEVKEWIKAICPNGDYGRFVLEGYTQACEEVEDEKRVVFELFTGDYKYYIVAIEKIKDYGYLGCQVSRRKPLPGEDYFRGRDLPDGKLIRDTWDRIVKGILEWELVEISGYVRMSDKDKQKQVIQINNENDGVLDCVNE